MNELHPSKTSPEGEASVIWKKETYPVTLACVLVNLEANCCYWQSEKDQDEGMDGNSWLHTFLVLVRMDIHHDGVARP